jgi:hypothetical protein
MVLSKANPDKNTSGQSKMYATLRKISARLRKLSSMLAVLFAGASVLDWLVGTTVLSFVVIADWAWTVDVIGIPIEPEKHPSPMMAINKPSIFLRRRMGIT